MKSMAISMVCLCLAGVAHAQLETRASRDAAGLREVASSAGESAPTLEELSQAYDRASASWMQVFGEEPFANAKRGGQIGMDALRKKGWLGPKSRISIAMLDARGDAAWVEAGECRAQLNVGSDGRSPVSKAMGGKAFEFLAAHELAHCRYDMEDPQERLPSKEALKKEMGSDWEEGALSWVLESLARPSGENGTMDLAEAYDEALADVLAGASLGAGHETISKAIGLRMGAAFMAMRQRVPPPIHLGAYGLWKVSSGARVVDLKSAKVLAVKSVLVQSMGVDEKPRWAMGLMEKNKDEFARLSVWAKVAYEPLLKSRVKEKDEDLYLSARMPSMFVMDLSEAKPNKTPMSPEEAMRTWKLKMWLGKSN